MLYFFSLFQDTVFFCVRAGVLAFFLTFYHFHLLKKKVKIPSVPLPPTGDGPPLHGQDEGGSIPSSPGILYISNHQSYFDPILISMAVGKIHFLARANLFTLPLLGPLIRFLHAVPLQRHKADKQALSTALQLLRKGQNLLMFPEGTRSAGPTVQPLHPGFVFLAKMAHAPILPLYIQGSGKAWEKGSLFPKLFQPISLYMGQPFYYNVSSFSQFCEGVRTVLEKLPISGGTSASDSL